MNRNKVFIWSLFDFGNSSYAVIIVAFVFAVYFTDVVCERSQAGDFYWSLGINISMIISAVLNPVGGAIADKISNKKGFLLFFTLLCIIPTGLMYYTGAGTVAFALILFIISNIGFQTGLTFYDALISDVTEEKYYNRVSGIGYAVGYVGSLVSVLLVFPFAGKYNVLFPLSALFFLIFSLPLFLFLKERKNKIKTEKKSYLQYATFGIKKVTNTVIHVRKYKNLRNYLFSYFLYIDAVNTIIFFAGIYASKSLNFEITELAVFFIIVQFTAMLGSLLFAGIGDKLGIKNSINITLIFWTLIVFFIFFFVDENSFLELGNFRIHYFFLVGGFAGTFLGATQSLSRAFMAKLTPRDMKTEFFGFYSLFEKTSTLIGPLTFGLVSYFSGSQNLAVLSVGIFFILGMLVLKSVRE
ncbi:MAG: MFS transporter [Ignavibacteria bacterium]|nr:MFS transporter [Ignavibacteria bacterium]